MSMEPSLDLKDLKSVDVRYCWCAECSPGGRGRSNGLITPDMLKVKGRVRETADVSGISEVKEELVDLAHWTVKQHLAIQTTPLHLII